MAVRDATESTVILAVGGTFGAAPFTGSRYTNSNAMRLIEISYTDWHTLSEQM